MDNFMFIYTQSVSNVPAICRHLSVSFAYKFTGDRFFDEHIVSSAFIEFHVSQLMMLQLAPELIVMGVGIPLTQTNSVISGEEERYPTMKA